MQAILDTIFVEQMTATCYGRFLSFRCPNYFETNAAFAVHGYTIFVGFVELEEWIKSQRLGRLRNYFPNILFKQSTDNTNENSAIFETLANLKDVIVLQFCHTICG